MNWLLSQSKMDIDTRIALAASLLIVLLLAIGLFSASSRWLKVRMKLKAAEPAKKKIKKHAPDPWTESGKRLRVEDEE